LGFRVLENTSYEFAGREILGQHDEEDAGTIEREKASVASFCVRLKKCPSVCVCVCVCVC